MVRAEAHRSHEGSLTPWHRPSTRCALPSRVPTPRPSLSDAVRKVRGSAPVLDGARRGEPAVWSRRRAGDSRAGPGFSRARGPPPLRRAPSAAGHPAGEVVFGPMANAGARCLRAVGRQSPPERSARDRGARARQPSPPRRSPVDRRIRSPGAHPSAEQIQWGRGQYVAARVRQTGDRPCRHLAIGQPEGYDHGRPDCPGACYSGCRLPAKHSHVRRRRCRLKRVLLVGLEEHLYRSTKQDKLGSRMTVAVVPHLGTSSAAGLTGPRPVSGIAEIIASCGAPGRCGGGPNPWCGSRRRGHGGSPPARLASSRG